MTVLKNKRKNTEKVTTENGPFLRSLDAFVFCLHETCLKTFIAYKQFFPLDCRRQFQLSFSELNSIELVEFYF